MAKGIYVGGMPYTSSRLPSGYTEVKYVASSGAQYIDTGFQPNQNTRVCAIAEITTMSGGHDYLFGAATGSMENEFAFGRTAAGTYASRYGSTDLTLTDSSGAAQITVDKDKQNIDVNGVTGTHAASTFSSDNNLYVFAENRAGAAYGHSTAKLYSMQIYHNGTLIRDFVPCITANGAIGLYDIVGESFYGNLGTVALTAGDEVSTAIEPKIYIGVNGISRKVKKAYIGVNGVARLWHGSNVKYLWEKYSANESVSYSKEYIDGFDLYLIEDGTSIRAYYGSTVTVSSSGVVLYSTGNTYLDLYIADSSLARTNPYFYTNSDEFPGVYYFFNKTIREVIAQINITYSKGTTSYGTIESESPDAYPTDGRAEDGYWYVFVGQA